LDVKVLCLLLASGAALGQESRGTILGRVTDTSGAVVVGARVVVVNSATNVAISSETNHEGNYEVPFLLPGNYRVSAELKGFKRAVRDGIELRVNDRLALDLSLQVGELAESVVVSGETPLLDTSSASLGMVVDTRRLSDLPTVGGGVSLLSRLTPGLASTSGGHDAGNPFDQGNSTGRLAVAGTRSSSSEVMMDGAPNMVERAESFSPMQDLVQEFKIHTASFDASLGHAAGAVVNVSIKSGGNGFHGTSYYHDSRVRAVPWFSNRWLWDLSTGPVTDEKRKQANPGWLHQRWGDTFTGPVLIPRLYNGRNRSFWSFGYEGLYVRRMTTFTGTVPSAEQRRGDLSGLLKLGAQYQVYDPATITAAPNGRFSRLPLAGNIIPASRISPIAQKLVSYWSEPNQTGTADGRQNLYRIAPPIRNYRAFLARLDHNFSEKHRIFGRFNQVQFDNMQQNMPTPAYGDITDRTGYGFVVDDVYVVSPSLLVNLRYGLTYENPRVGRFSQGFDLTSVGFQKSLVDEIAGKIGTAGIAFPQIVVDGGGYTNLGADGGNSRSVYYQTFTGTVSRITGNHSLRTGAEFRLLRENGYNFGNVAPRIEFGNGWTRGPLDTSTAAPIGQGLASLLLGFPTGGAISNNASRAEQSTFYSLFFQDDWRLTPKVTVNLGLRWEYEGPTTERFNRSIRGFDFTTPNPIAAAAQAAYARAPIPEVTPSAFRTLGGLTFPGVGGVARGLWAGDRNNFAPRVSIAWQVTRNTALRLGYGIFFDVSGVDRNDVNQGGFNQPTSLIPSLDNGLIFRATLANPFPDGIQVPTGAADGLRTFLGRGVSYFEESSVNPYMQRWALSVQRELPGRILMQTAYVGNRGTKMSVSREWNAVPRLYLSTSPVRDQATIDYLGAQVTNPFALIAEFAGSGLAGVRTARSQLLRPYPHFTSVATNVPTGYSWYHSLQLHAERRFANGFTFQTSWTWSKLMEAISYLNDTDPTPERCISDQDFPHRLSASGIYELPVGRGKRFGRGWKGFLDGALGGWQLQGTYEGQSGPALGFGNAIFSGSLADIPLPVGERSVERWFNADAGFERASNRQLNNNIRTLPSRFSGVRADGINNFDLSVFKYFRITERFRAQFRLESFNALNHPQFSAPNTTPASTAFGTITAESGHGQRQVTLALKILF
jgi:hypothetical protein